MQTLFKTVVGAEKCFQPETMDGEITQSVRTQRRFGNSRQNGVQSLVCRTWLSNMFKQKTRLRLAFFGSVRKLCSGKRFLKAACRRTGSRSSSDAQMLIRPRDSLLTDGICSWTDERLKKRCAAKKRQMKNGL